MLNGQYNDFDQAIVACSTGALDAAIGIIRISCSQDFDFWRSIFSPLPTQIKNRFLYRAELILDAKVVDDILFVWFSKNASFTGQNVLELHVHGNLLNINQVIQYIVEKNYARHALPGEFSFRAVKNGKMTLAQVEGLGLFLNAQSPYILQRGLSLFQGDEYRELTELRDLYIKLRQSLELGIDFQEDIGSEAAENLLESSWKNYYRKISILNERSRYDASSLLFPEVILFGPTNAGKSSLFNQLLGRDRAIISSEAGTTRDYISESFEYQKAKFKLVDTAGIRSTHLSIEREGINKSKKLINNAFYKILVLSPRSQIDDEDWSYINKISFDLIILTHADWSDFKEWRNKIEDKLLMHGSIEILCVSFEKNGPIEPEKLKDEVFSRIFKSFQEKYGENPIILDRHRLKIKEIYSATYSLSEQWPFLKNDPTLLASEINLLKHHFDELLGIVHVNEVLYSVFENFCIGK